MSKWLSQFIFSPHPQQLGIIILLNLCNLNEDLLKLSCGFNLHSSTRHCGLVSFPVFFFFFFFFNVPFVFSAKRLFKFVAHSPVGMVVFFVEQW